jgi:hypothetical protein
MLKSTEDFINLGASTSSSTGKPYLFRCGSAQAVESKAASEPSQHAPSGQLGKVAARIAPVAAGAA